ncbi:methyltransferase domain-containing protein [Wukongibacter baidiensis]|uniref:class I SAM-dependent methyltransferase n=1 Tax=Wukongibacter baidiensis TaxID=1723361 RepID=UPI003D7F3A5D
MNNEKNIKIFSKWSKLYDIFFGSKIINKQREKAINLLRLQENDRVLLIGIGTGEDLKFLPKDVKVTGIDITDEMLEITRNKGENLGINNLEIINMDGQNLDFTNESFDAIVLNLILAVIPDASKCLREAERVLKPDGKIVIFDKFLEADKKVGVFREILNKITTSLGTDINRRFSEIMKDTNLKITEERESMLRGMYRIILLQK